MAGPRGGLQPGQCRQPSDCIWGGCTFFYFKNVVSGAGVPDFYII